ncbi:MAG: hypothetical protein GX774_06540 [Armatimonadetes bacterium]|nr:hypothetical protein [Armatimonadota bacterium]
MSTHTSAAALILGAALLGLGTPAASAAADKPTVEVHAYMQNRGYLAAGANPTFRAERISVSTQAALPHDSSGYIELYYHPWATASGLYLESAYYDTPLGPGRLRVGKGRRLTFGITPSYGNRRTSNYGVVAEAFTQDRIQGVQYLLQRGALDAGLSVQTAFRLGTRALGEIPGDAAYNAAHAVPHLSLRDLPGELSSKPQVSARLGGRWGDGPNGLRAGFSGSWGGLDGRDLANLRTSAPTNPLTPGGTPALLPASTTRAGQWQLGPDFTYRHPSGLLAQGELFFAEVSALGFAGGYLLGGYEAPSGWRFYARYGLQEMHTARTANPLSWDTRQFSLSVVQPLRQGLWLQYEYERNSERTHGPKVNNDLFFAELFTGF